MNETPGTAEIHFEGRPTPAYINRAFRHRLRCQFDVSLGYHAFVTEWDGILRVLLDLRVDVTKALIFKKR
jgi:hypothetical protein